MILSKQQESAIEELVPIGRLAISGKTKFLQLKPRTHTLICAPSGSGKSFLMEQLGQLIGVKILHLNISTWQPYSAKSGNYTWDVVVKFLQENEKGIILLDELDKLDGDNEWSQFIQLEVHELLDGRILSEVELDTTDLFLPFNP